MYRSSQEEQKYAQKKIVPVKVQGHRGQKGVKFGVFPYLTVESGGTCSVSHARVSFCHHFASVVSSLSKILSSETAGPIGLKLYMNDL